MADPITCASCGEISASGGMGWVTVYEAEGFSRYCVACLSVNGDVRAGDSAQVAADDPGLVRERLIARLVDEIEHNLPTAGTLFLAIECVLEGYWDGLAGLTVLQAQLARLHAPSVTDARRIATEAQMVLHADRKAGLRVVLGRVLSGWLWTYDPERPDLW